MINKIKLIIFTVVISVGLGLATNAAVKNVQVPTKVSPKTTAQAVTAVQKPAAAKTSFAYEDANALSIVVNPTKYLNKHVKIKAKFDKFSTLGLDYKPAFRSSEKYITFLIKRDDVINHTVPLSEMKNFLLREEADKYVDLKPGDDIEYSGTVFSDALGDAWVNVEKFIVLNPKQPAPSSTKK